MSKAQLKAVPLLAGLFTGALIGFLLTYLEITLAFNLYAPDIIVIITIINIGIDFVSGCLGAYALYKGHSVAGGFAIALCLVLLFWLLFFWVPFYAYGDWIAWQQIFGWEI